MGIWIFRIPHAKSSMVILTAAALLAFLSEPSYNGIAILIISYLLFLFTFDYLFENSNRPFRLNYVLTILVDLAPVIAALLFYGLRVVLSLAPSAILVLIYVILSSKRLGRSTVALAVGSAILSGFYLYFCSIIGPLSFSEIMIGVMLVMYTVSQVIYVESRMAFRRISPYIPAALTLMIVVPAVLLPIYFLVPIIEPVVKTVHAIFDLKKISEYKMIERLGRTEAIKYAFFLLLMSVSVVLMHDHSIYLWLFLCHA
ncbi:MAG: hypothetical protein ACP5TZ_06575 [Nitrososphaeria archaeon]